MNVIEFGKCEICGVESNLQRTYFKYDIKCECHFPRHFDLIIHCNTCIPKQPKNTKIILKTESLNKL